jgi:alkylresorcinol/alkylpyrone synthase
MIGFMGCYAAIPALRVARDTCLAHRDARVLVVCCELGSLHFQPGPADAAMLASCLFADGAAAAIVAAADEPIGLGLALSGDACVLIPESSDAMAWEAGPQGFLIHLAPSVAPRIAEDLGRVAVDLIGSGRVPRDVRWIVHPGGPRILDTVADRLDLGDGALASSYRSLARGGNRSSATVLATLADDLGGAWHGPLALLAFGPGLTADAMLVERHPREIACVA